MRGPTGRVEPRRLEQHGHVRVDDYYWLKDREDPEVMQHLEAENAHAEAVMAHTKAFEASLFQEIRGRIKQTDESVPCRRDDFFYYVRFEEGKEYALHCRKRGSAEAAEEVMLDGNRLAEGHDYFQIGGRDVTPGQDLLAYSVDTVGRRIYTIRFKNLETGRTLEETIEGVAGNLVWANDSRTLFYARQDPVTLRPDRIFRHVLGTPVESDTQVYEETDDTFWVRVWKTKSRRFLMIASLQTVSAEYRYLEADDPDGEFRVVQPRQRDHEYTVDHLGDHFYIKTNHLARNFRLVRAPIEDCGMEHWEEVIAHREDVLLEGFELFEGHLVAEERRDGLVQLRVRDFASADEHYLPFEEPAYLAWVDENRQIDSHTLRFGYTSLTTPRTIFDYDMVTRERTLLKQVEVLGGFDSAEYRTERLSATAADGTRIPISLVYRRGFERDGTRPLLLYGYGSYGHSLDAAFESSRLSLLDRGFVYAIAHVRGGEELGRAWYEDGKLLNKMNTFTDFIACAEHLVRERYAAGDRLFAMGRSAGGLLVGAVVNLRPGLFRGIVAGVPFVDVVTTMLDDSIPLTTFEYDEWGNPSEKAFYDYMLSYSPYDNVTAQDYPNLLVMTGLHDSQVQYWEPAKWVAKLRATATGDARLLLKTNLEAGHGGASGRYRRYRETAFEYAFLLDLAGIDC